MYIYTKGIYYTKATITTILSCFREGIRRLSVLHNLWLFFLEFSLLPFSRQSFQHNTRHSDHRRRQLTLRPHRDENNINYCCLTMEPPSSIPIITPHKVSPTNHTSKTGSMSSFFRSKRRASQALRSKFSSTNLTRDLDQNDTYTPLYHELLKIETEFDALGASFGQFASNLETWTHASRNLAFGAKRFYQDTTDVVDTDPEFTTNVINFGSAAQEVDDNIRRHVTKDYIDHVIGPLKHVVVDQIPLLKSQHLERYGKSKAKSASRIRKAL